MATKPEPRGSGFLLNAFRDKRFYVRPPDFMCIRAFLCKAGLGLVIAALVLGYFIDNGLTNIARAVRAARSLSPGERDE